MALHSPGWHCPLGNREKLDVAYLGEWVAPASFTVAKIPSQ
jgi:hypothetical protein